MATIDTTKVRTFFVRKTKKAVNPTEVFRRLSIREFQVLNFHPTVYAFVISSEKIPVLEQKGEYIVVIFNKIPDHSYLFVAEESFCALEAAEECAKRLASSYPEYGLCEKYEIN